MVNVRGLKRGIECKTWKRKNMRDNKRALFHIDRNEEINELVKNGYNDKQCTIQNINRVEWVYEFGKNELKKKKKQK